MTFDEWWATLDTWEQNRRVKEDAKEAFEAGKLEAAQHILDMWNEPWPVTKHVPGFIKLVKAYVGELK